MQKQEKSLWYILLAVLETNVIEMKIYPWNIRRVDVTTADSLAFPSQSKNINLKTSFSNTNQHKDAPPSTKQNTIVIHKS
jgi:hypothetical protein